MMACIDDGDLVFVGVERFFGGNNADAVDYAISFNACVSGDCASLPCLTRVNIASSRDLCVPTSSISAHSRY